MDAASPPGGRTRKVNAVLRHDSLIGMMILAAAFVYGSLQVASGLRSRNESAQGPSRHQVTVTGSAQQAVDADTFEWDASLSSTQATTSAALAQINGWNSQVHDALLGAGALGSEITFGTLQVQTNSDQTGAVASFSESETVTVKSNRLAAMGRVSEVANQLLGANVPFIAQPPKYTFTGLKQLRPVLTAQATADARKRAQAALGGRGRLGASLSISVGPFSVDAPGSVNIGSGDFYTGGIQQVVSVAVTATYSTSS